MQNLQIAGYTFQKTKKEDIITSINLTPMNLYYTHEVTDKYKQRKIKKEEDKIKAREEKYDAELSAHLIVAQEKFKAKKIIEAKKHFDYDNKKASYVSSIEIEAKKILDLQADLQDDSDFKRVINNDKFIVNEDWEEFDRQLIKDKSVLDNKDNEEIIKFNEEISSKEDELEMKKKEIEGKINEKYDKDLADSKKKIIRDKDREWKSYLNKCKEENKKAEVQKRIVLPSLFNLWNGKNEAAAKKEVDEECIELKTQIRCEYDDPDSSKKPPSECKDYPYSNFPNKYEEAKKIYQDTSVRKKYFETELLKNLDFQARKKELSVLKKQRDSLVEQIIEREKQLPLDIAESLAKKTKDINDIDDIVIKKNAELTKTVNQKIAFEKLSKDLDYDVESMVSMSLLKSPLITDSALWDQDISDQLNLDNAESLKQKNLDIAPYQDEIKRIQGPPPSIMTSAGKLGMKVLKKVGNAGLQIKYLDFSWNDQTMSVDTTNSVPIEIYSPTFVFFGENDSYGPYNMMDFEEYKVKRLDESNQKNIKFEYILKYYKEAMPLTKNKLHQTVFVFKPDIELYKRLFEDFSEESFFSEFYASYMNYKNFKYFDTLTIRRENTHSKNPQNNNMLFNFIPLSIFSNLNIFAYFKLDGSPKLDGEPSFLENYISMDDLSKMEIVRGEEKVGQKLNKYSF